MNHFAQKCTKLEVQIYSSFPFCSYRRRPTA